MQLPAVAGSPAFSPAEQAAMRAALELAARGPATGPNPRVGCVLLDDSGAVVAQGWHAGAGTAHAEAAALEDLRARAGAADVTGIARGLTAVVTLEPCSHTGRTGPCALALIAAGVRRVVHAVDDPNAQAAGGAALLRRAGVDVASGLLREEAAALNRRWLHAMALGRPFVTWKFAATLDGRSAAADGTSRWITSAAARADVHRRRAEADAVVVGTGTVLADDPQLTVRGEDGRPASAQPLRVVVGTRPVPPTARVLDDAAPTVVLTDGNPADVLAALWAREVRHAFLEGGPRLAAAFLRAGLVDEVVAYLAPALLGGGPAAVAGLGVETIGDILRLEVADVALVGGDVRIVACPHPPPQHPEPVPPAPPSREERNTPMFTGIVEELGSVAAVTTLPDAARLTVRGSQVLTDAGPGASIAVNGVCLTVVEYGEDWFTADVMAETLTRTGLGDLQEGSPVNLERPMAASGRFGGHVVQGHVDGTGTVLSRQPSEHWEIVRIGLPAGLARYLVEKGSVTVDGVSLTVVEVVDDGPEGAWFSVSLIPETLQRTTLGSRSPGERVNLEVDVLAKYVERLLGTRS
ncbi:MAG: bifunctional diaminohydroxyphosphoribosylaminopyrimidine deaminase/5-amino-6-(5-phosphoribosylamino)uracil reductase RibD [Kineosporiaceae bacterium]